MRPTAIRYAMKCMAKAFPRACWPLARFSERGQMAIITAISRLDDGAMLGCHSSILPLHKTHSLYNPSIYNSQCLSLTYKVADPLPFMAVTTDYLTTVSPALLQKV